LAQYFTEENDEYIKRYIEATTDEEKHALFNEGIRPAFEKLVENLIYVYKFYTLDDVETLKQDCFANLYEMLPKFKPERGTKGFSYFNVIARNWFIQKTRERAKKNNIERNIHVQIDREDIKNNPEMTFSCHEKDVVEREFWVSFFNELDFWRTKLTKPSERAVLEAVIVIMKNSDSVAIYNKKAVYMFLREMTGLNEKQVAMSLKKMRELYVKWKFKYYDEE